MNNLLQNANQCINEQKYWEAIKFFKSYLNKNNNDCYVFNQLGWAYDQQALITKDINKQKQYQLKARQYFKLAYSNKDTKKEAVRGIATVLMHQQQYDEALKYYKQAHKIEKDFDTYNDLGNIYQKINKDQIAIKYYKQALKMTKNKDALAIPLLNLILINKKLKNIKEKDKYLSRLRNLSKKSQLAENLLKNVQR